MCSFWPTENVGSAISGASTGGDVAVRVLPPGSIRLVVPPSQWTTSLPGLVPESLQGSLRVPVQTPSATGSVAVPWGQP